MSAVLYIGQVARSRSTRLSLWHFVVSLCLTILCGVSTSTARAQSSLPATDFHPGQQFPEVVLPSLKDGQPMSITEFRGKKLILQVFASW
jgi:hypothetical protein